MSESCFHIELIDKVKRKARGTLQFGRSTDVKLAVHRRMQITEDVEFPEKKINSPVLSFRRQLPRTLNATSINNRMVSRDDLEMMDKLPAHMHNVNNRFGCSNTLERTLRETKYQHADFVEAKPRLGVKKSFRKDGSPPRTFDPQRPPR